ncbi:MAG TPA: cation diffusion facilitator family transporter [Ktedonobacterales bacterium]|nr:cation diffusion facilitator family transporter [Ktedonobacterales bacterium]
MNWHYSRHYSPVGMHREERRAREGMRAAIIGIISNSVLIALKGSIGVIGGSQALVADAIHSGSDLLNSCIALGSVLYARRPPDWDHPYGHERVEAFASTIAAVLIGVAGIVVAYDSITTLIYGETRPPAALALVAAGIALLIKLGLNRYVGAIARRTKSKAMATEARDHFIDVIVSAVVIAGIGLARLGATWFDGVAGLCVAGFILITATSLIYNAAQELMDTSLTPEQRQVILCIAEGVDGVRHVQAIAGRTIGHTILVEMHVDVDPAITVAEGARIVDTIKEQVLSHIDEVRTVVVELNTNQFEPEALHLMAPPTRTGPTPAPDHPANPTPS